MRTSPSFRLACLILAGALTTPIATTVASAEPATVPGLVSVLDDCSQLSLASAGRHVTDRSVTVGHLRILFADGTLVPVLGKAGTILGAYFEGRGGYVYTTDDPADRDALASNVASVAPSLRPVDGKLNDTFKNALLLFSEPQFMELYAQQAAEETPTDAMAAAFPAILAGARNSYGELDFRTAVARLNERGKWVYAEFGGSMARIGYAYDAVFNGTERLFTFRKLIDYDSRFTETVSFQDLPGWTRDRRLSVVLKHADISISTTDNKFGTIDSTMTFRVREAGTRMLSLMLLSNRDPDTPDWQSPHQKLTVKRVVDANGNDVPFSHKYRELVVEIPRTTTADSDVQLRFETEGDVFLDRKGRHADSYFSLHGADWFPTPPGWAGQQFTFALRVRVKKPWRPITSGREVSLRDDGPFVVAEARSDVPSVEIAVLAGRYFTHVETIGGLTVRVHSYAWTRDDVLHKMPKLAATFVDIYSSILGPVAIDELDIVEVPGFRLLASLSGMVLIGSEPQEDIRSRTSSGTNDRLARGIAYQWFGHKAIPVGPHDRWLKESFASYFAGIAMGAIGAKEQSLYGLDGMLADWRGEDKYCAKGGTIATADYLGGWDGYRDTWCLLRSRGPLVLHMLRTSIGNDVFFAATKRYLDNANSGPATTEDYVQAVSDTVGTDMDWFFDQWVRKSGNAEVEIEQHVDGTANHQFRLWGTVRQKPGGAFKRLVIPLVWTSAGAPNVRVVFADQPETTFEFLLPTKPGAVKPDPFRNNLAVYK